MTQVGLGLGFPHAPSSFTPHSLTPQVYHHQVLPSLLCLRPSPPRTCPLPALQTLSFAWCHPHSRSEPNSLAPRTSLSPSHLGSTSSPRQPWTLPARALVGQHTLHHPQRPSQARCLPASSWNPTSPLSHPFSMVPSPVPFPSVSPLLPVSPNPGASVHLTPTCHTPPKALSISPAPLGRLLTSQCLWPHVQPHMLS